MAKYILSNSQIFTWICAKYESDYNGVFPNKWQLKKPTVILRPIWVMFERLGTFNGSFHLFPYDSKIMKKCHDLNLKIAKDLVIT